MREGEERGWDWDEAPLRFARARNDIAAVQALLMVELPDTAAFHAQQAVEKVLKGLLAAAAEPLRRTHNIEALADLAHPHWPSLVELPFSLVRVDHWYVDTRYPGGAEATPDASEIAAAAEAIAQLLDRVMSEAGPP
ncbi:MAG TPA: HEPN domain-containing protein [Stellaceae bacterium]|jgi:HEPN domain-containing protein|nr:HEPN domain-containing protein [Stellaceae bacterium]